MINNIYETPILEASNENVEERVTEADTLFGIVTDCLKLNIREKPDKGSTVVTVVTCLEELMIDIGKSNDDWYAVCTASGMEGFCMKKFVAVRQ